MLALVLSAILGAGPAKPARPPCAKSPRVVDACYAVHGKLFLSNGSPPVRIWRLGTQRILGVWGAENPEDIWLPKPVADLTFRFAYIGDFTVCPFSAERPGWMRKVCIESVANVVKTDD